MGEYLNIRDPVDGSNYFYDLQARHSGCTQAESLVFQVTAWIILDDESSLEGDKGKLRTAATLHGLHGNGTARSAKTVDLFRFRSVSASGCIHSGHKVQVQYQPVDQGAGGAPNIVLTEIQTDRCADRAKRSLHHPDVLPTANLFLNAAHISVGDYFGVSMNALSGMAEGEGTVDPEIGIITHPLMKTANDNPDNGMGLTE
jgi:hypothetical protein